MCTFMTYKLIYFCSLMQLRRRYSKEISKMTERKVIPYLPGWCCLFFLPSPSKNKSRNSIKVCTSTFSARRPIKLCKGSQVLPDITHYVRYVGFLVSWPFIFHIYHLYLCHRQFSVKFYSYHLESTSVFLEREPFSWRNLTLFLYRFIPFPAHPSQYGWHLSDSFTN